MPTSATPYEAMELKRPPVPSLLRSHSTTSRLSRWVSPKVVDAILAGLTLAFATLVLHAGDLAMGQV